MRLGKRKRHVAEKAYPTVREYSLRGVQNRHLPSSANATRYALVPRASLGAGVVKTVTVTIHATSQDGTAIPPTTQQFQVSGAAPRLLL